MEKYHTFFPVTQIHRWPRVVDSREVGEENEKDSVDFLAV